MDDPVASVNLLSGNDHINDGNQILTTTVVFEWNLTTGNMSQTGDSLCDAPVIPPTTLEQVLFIFAYGLVSATAIFGNAVVCIIVIAFEKMRKMENVFLFNLALADVILACFCVPFAFVPNLILGYYPFGMFMCKLVNYSQIVSVLVSSYTLVAISVERYVGVFYPFRPKMTLRQVLSVVLITWILSLCVSLPAVIFSETIDYQYSEDPSFKVTLCMEKWPPFEDDGFYSYIYGMVLMVLQYFLPLVIMGLCYTRIAIYLWKIKTPGEALKGRDKKIKDDKMRMTKMMIVVVVLYIVSWLPLNMYIVIQDRYNKIMQCYKYIHFVWFGCHWLAMSHATYNPIIYFWMSSKFRAGFVYVLNLIFCFRRKSLQWLIDEKLVAGYPGQNTSKYTEAFSKYDCSSHGKFTNGRQSLSAVSQNKGWHSAANGKVGISINRNAMTVGNPGSATSRPVGIGSPVKNPVESWALLPSALAQSSDKLVFDPAVDLFDPTEVEILLPDHPGSHC